MLRGYHVEYKQVSVRLTAERFLTMCFSEIHVEAETRSQDRVEGRYPEAGPSVSCTNRVREAVAKAGTTTTSGLSSDRSSDEP